MRDERSRHGLHRHAVDVLGKRIAGGELPAGATLPNETDLGGELGVSRTVVREAVKVLAAKGLVVTRPRTGTRVEPRCRWDIVDHDVLDWVVATGPGRRFYGDLFEVRSILEPRAAALAAVRRSDAEAEELRSLYRRLGLAADLETYIEADLPFHAAILKASHNELLMGLSSTLEVALRAGLRITSRTEAGPASSLLLHQAVAEAITAGNAREAETAMQALIAHASEDLETVLADDAQP